MKKTDKVSYWKSLLCALMGDLNQLSDILAVIARDMKDDPHEGAVLAVSALLEQMIDKYPEADPEIPI